MFSNPYSRGSKDEDGDEQYDDNDDQQDEGSN